MDGFDFGVELNGIQYLEYTDDSRANETMRDGYSGYIGLFNYNIEI